MQRPAHASTRTGTPTSSRAITVAALALLTTALVLTRQPAGAADDSPSRVLGYDHLIHDGLVVAHNGEPPTCVACHTLDKQGAPRAPGHSACFSAPCHAMPTSNPNGAKAAKGANETAGPRSTLCLACHSTDAPKKKAKVVYPPYAVDLDFGIRFAHDVHAAPSRADGGAGCELCHTTQGAAPAGKTRGAGAASATARSAATAPHGRCVGCHTVADEQQAHRPLMQDCLRCHVQIAGRYVVPRIVRGPYRVTAAHQAHVARDGTRGAQCLTCHAAIEQAGGEELPAPAMMACETCHDGKTAFAALGPNCRRCHTQPDRRALPSDAPPRSFSHLTHAQRGLDPSCATCHRLTTDGSPAPAAADHQPCAAAGCHADDFRAPAPRICGGCHVGTEPFRPLRADVAWKPWTEFGVEFDHAGHATRAPAACTTCHTGIPGGADMRLGKGHASCAGAACHSGDAAKPALTACDSCHRRGLLDGRAQVERQKAWSVAAKFRHKPHATSACAACHTVDRATKLADIPAPRKPACDACHDGARAFKMTGHGCPRCHGIE